MKTPFISFSSWLIGTLVAISASFFAWKTYEATFEIQPQLSISETLRYELQSSRNFAGAQLDYHLNNIKINRVTVSTYKIVNQGSIPIDSKDFTKPLTARVSGEGRFISASILSVHPKSLEITFNKADQTAIEFKPTLLNPGDEINIAIITQPNKPDEKSNLNPPQPIEWITRIKGMKDINFQSYEDVTELQTIIFTQKATSALQQFRNGWQIVLTPTSLIPFIVMAFLLSQALYATQTKSLQSTLLNTKNNLKPFLVFLVSVSTSEVLIFYIFGSPTNLYGAHYVNTSIVILYCAIAIYFLLTTHKTSPQKSEPDNRTEAKTKQNSQNSRGNKQKPSQQNQSYNKKN